MQSRQLLGGAAAILAGIAALAAVGTLPRSNLHQRSAGAAGVSHLIVATSRSAAQRADPAGARLDAALADLVRHAPRARAGRELADLHTMNPAARFARSAATGEALVLVDAATRGDPLQLRASLEALGLERAALYANDVGGWLPVGRIAAAAVLPELAEIHAAMPRTRSAGGILATQGDYAQRSSVVRAANPALTGAGITVGVISDSFDCFRVYAQPGSGVPASGYTGYAYYGFTATAEEDEASGALPPTVNVLAEPYTGTGAPSATGNCLGYDPQQGPFTDEGRAMLQVVHAVAPGAGLAFYTGENSQADFANGIGRLAAAGARVIVDDLGYFDEPFYQDGIIAQAIDSVAAAGVAYFSSAGNDADAAWESISPSFATLATGTPQQGEYLLNFDTTGATTATSLPITIAALQPGQFLGIVIGWDQPFMTGGGAGATSQIDVCVAGTSGVIPLVEDIDGNSVSCTGANAPGANPVQVLVLGNPDTAAGFTSETTITLSVGLANGSPAPGRIIVSVQTDGQTSPAPLGAFATHSPTLQGHAGAAGGAAVGAAFYFQTPQCGASVAQLEPYSSLGGRPILFDAAGNRLATPTIRQKPDFVAPDGVNNTFLGFPLTAGSFDGVTIGSSGQLPTSITQCQNDASYPSFFGTSAAAPHAAGVAALLLQASAAATPAAIYAALQSTALPMGGSGPTPNFYSGYGFIQADRALAQLAPAGSSSSGGGGSSSSSGSSAHGGGGALGLPALGLLVALTAALRRKTHQGMIA